MKNYKFVLGFLLSATMATAVQAASITPNTETNRAALTPTGGAQGAFRNANNGQLLLNRAPPPPDPRKLAMVPGELPTLPPVKNFLRDATLAKAFHYLDGSGDAVQGLRAQTKMAQPKAVSKSVSEPASEILLLAALSALAIAIRRQSPS